MVVNLWASWCGPCRQEMPVLAQAQRQQPHIAFVFVNQGETADVVRRYLAGSGLALKEVLLDPASSVGAAVASRGLPTTLFYDAQGRQVDAHFGVLNAAALAAKTERWRTLAMPAVPNPTPAPP
jgi:thiol-disulfide isomerase/thioredoxin